MREVFGLTLALLILFAAAPVSSSGAPAPDPRTDPADLSIWPNQASRANGDRWLVENHDRIRRMNPRLLVINFDNHAPRERLEALVNAIIAAVAEASRYHGYSDRQAPVFLQYEVFKLVDLRETSAPASQLNSRAIALKAGVTNGVNLDCNGFFNDTYARHFAVLDPDVSGRFLKLEELVDRGIVHEVWIITNGDDSGVRALECVELKPRYSERFKRIEGEFVQAGNGGDPDQRWTGRSVRLGFINSTRGPGCFLESLSHAIEGTATSGAIPYFTRYFSEFAGYDLRRRLGVSFDSFYDLGYSGHVVDFPDSHTAVIRSSKGATVTVSNYFAIGGNVHWPPNARGHYDLDNTNAVLSTIEDWRIGTGPGGKDLMKPWSNEVLARYRNSAPDCVGQWLIYWRQNFPGLDNKQRDDYGEPMKNWWPFLFY